MAEVILFPVRRPTVFIDPVGIDDGSWGIFRQDHGYAANLVTTRADFGAAEKVAREMAAWIDGDYLETVGPAPRGAA